MSDAVEGPRTATITTTAHRFSPTNLTNRHPAASGNTELEKQNGTFAVFSKKYNCTRLLCYEHHEDIHISIARVKLLKGWRRGKKLALIPTTDPGLKDLAATWA